LKTTRLQSTRFPFEPVTLDPDGVRGTIDFLSRVFEQSYSQVGFDLDGSLESAAELDRIAHEVRDRYVERGCEGMDEASRTEAENFVHGAGAYLGKLIVDNLGGSWVAAADGGLHIIGLGEMIVRPFEAAAEQLCRCEPCANPFTGLVAGIREQARGGV
jgi:hypothetical protein